MMGAFPAWVLPAGLTIDDVRATEGFVYRITHMRTQQSYIGKKWTKAKRGARMIESDWQTYWSSSLALLRAVLTDGTHVFRREIVSLHPTRELTDFAEVDEQKRCDVLNAKLPDGSPAYYNLSIHTCYQRGFASID